MAHERSFRHKMARALRYLAAGLAALGAAGRPGHSVYIELLGQRGPSRDRSRTDAQAIHGDWQAVGNDLRGAMEKVRREATDPEVLPEPA